MLDPEQRRQLLGPLDEACPSCEATRTRHYCRSCDEFFVACGCSGPEHGAHLEHRVYLWTPNGVIAIPDFDNL